MNRDSMIIFGVIGALFLILLVMFLMTAEMFEEGYRDRRKAMRKKKNMPVRKKRAARKMRRRRN